MGLQPRIAHAKRQDGSPLLPPVVDRFTTHEPPINWYALGDSYTAGPGTGDDYDEDQKCTRNNGSYAIQMNRQFPFEESNHVDFVACSGDKAPDTLIRVRDLVEENKADFMVMTLGGNDIHFSDIATECLVKAKWLPGDCTVTIELARGLLAAQKFEDDLHAVYDAVFARMKDDHHYQLYHIFYHRFFNDQTEWCDKESFKLTGYPKLTRELRSNMNSLADALNKRLGEVVNSYINKQTKASWSQGPRLIGLNPDNLTRENGETYGLFDGHRFCEPGFTRLRDPSIWFFATYDKDHVSKRDVGLEILEQVDSANCGKSPRYATDTDFRQGCDAAQSSASGQAGILTLPELVTQTFHPKSAGFNAETRMLQESLQKNRPAET